jgi:hypothetical protein
MYHLFHENIMRYFVQNLPKINLLQLQRKMSPCDLQNTTSFLGQSSHTICLIKTVPRTDITQSWKSWTSTYLHDVYMFWPLVLTTIKSLIPASHLILGYQLIESIKMLSHCCLSSGFNCLATIVKSPLLIFNIFFW